MRSFRLDLPRRLGAPNPERTLAITVPAGLWVPKILVRDGLRRHEAETTSVVLALTEQLGDDACFFDVGSNVGLFCWLVAGTSRARVIGFEPTPELVTACRRTLDDNDLHAQIEQLALGRRPGRARLYLSDATDASNSLDPDFRGGEESIEVDVHTLDQYVADHGLVPRVIKIDTESTEPDVIAGGRRTIAGSRPWIVCEVLTAAAGRALDELLAPYGYRYYVLTDRLPLLERTTLTAPTLPGFRNWLLAPEPLSEEVLARIALWRDAIARTRPDLAPDLDPEARPISEIPLDVRADGPPHLAARDVRDADFATAPSAPGRVRLSGRIADDGARYVVFGGGSLDEAPARSVFPLDTPRPIWVTTCRATLRGSPRHQLWLLQYDATGARLQSLRTPIGEGRTLWPVDLDVGARSVRLAIRAAGNGDAEIGPVRISQRSR